MKANEAPEKIYLNWVNYPLEEMQVEYTRTEAFIEKAAEFLYNYNQKQVLKHGARTTLGCGEYTINVDDFRNYIKGEKVWK